MCVFLGLFNYNLFTCSSPPEYVECELLKYCIMTRYTVAPKRPIYRSISRISKTVKLLGVGGTFPG